MNEGKPLNVNPCDFMEALFLSVKTCAVVFTDSRQYGDRHLEVPAVKALSHTGLILGIVEAEIGD